MVMPTKNLFLDTPAAGFDHADIRLADAAIGCLAWWSGRTHRRRRLALLLPA